MVIPGPPKGRSPETMHTGLWKIGSGLAAARRPGMTSVDALYQDRSTGDPGHQASAPGGALRVWSAYALLMMLVAVPVFSTVLPPLFDYPNHLARMHLLAEGGNAFYGVHWAPLPNLAQDLIVPSLARVMPLELASKLFLVMVFGLIAGGTIWLNRVATGAWRLWPLLSFLLLYNRVFLWGFVNYLFGIGVALAGIALWLSLEREQWWLRVLASTVVAIACYFSHIAAFGFYALVILGVELAPAFGELRARQWPALGRRIAIAGTQFAVPAALLLGNWRPTAAGVVHYAAVWRKADLLFSIFDNYNRVLDISSFGLLLGLLGWLAWTRSLRPTRRLAWSLGLVFLAYLLLPSQIYGASGTDHRLPIAVFLLLIGASAPRFPNRRAAAIVGAVTASLLLVRLAVIEHVWRQADQIYSADLAGIDALPRGAKLAVAMPAGLTHVAPIPEAHLPALAIARREVFVPTLFADLRQQPIALNPPYAALAEAALPPQIWAALVDDDIAERVRLLPALEQYDFAVFIDKRPIHVPPSRCLRSIFERPSFQIFAVLHKAGCMSSDG
jgi:hypothetical protein